MFVLVEASAALHPTAIMPGAERDGFQLIQVQRVFPCPLALKSSSNDHEVSDITSSASYILTCPSSEQVATFRPWCFGANFTSVT